MHTKNTGVGTEEKVIVTQVKKPVKTSSFQPG